MGEKALASDPDDQRPAGLQAGPVEREGAVDVLCRPGDEDAAGRGPEQLDEVAFEVRFAHDRLVAAEVGALHHQHIQVARRRLARHCLQRTPLEILRG